MKVRNIAIIGYGIIGQQIEQFVREAHKEGPIDFCYFDDILSAQGIRNAFPFHDYRETRFSGFEFYIGLGYNHLQLRKEILDSLIRMDACLPSLIHYTTYLHPSVTVGKGSVIYPMCNIGFNVHVGHGSIVNKSCTLAHDSEVGDGSFISPSVTFCGGVKLGNSSFVGAGSVVADKVNIGDRVTVGIGSIITRDVTDGLAVIGNPARIVSKLKFK